VGGKVVLKKMKGIKYGEVKFVISKEEGKDYSLSGSGTATPDFASIPGLDASFSVSYKNGLFKVEGKAKYEKGKLNGTLMVGVTNGTIDEKGNVQEGAGGKDLVIYGNGSLTITLTKSLTWKLDVFLDPKGAILLSAVIKIHSSPFDPIKKEKELFSIDKNIPLVGIPFANVFIKIGAGATVFFDWQPLVIDFETTLDKTPLEEIKKGKLGGTSTLKIHSIANAGIKLSIKVGAGVAITVVALSVNITGSVGVGIKGDAGADIKAEWDSEKGLKFKEATFKIEITPQALLELKGTIEAELDLIVSTVKIYTYDLGSAKRTIDISGLAFKGELPVEFDETGTIKKVEYEKLIPKFDKESGERMLKQSITGESSPTPVNQEDSGKAIVRDQIDKDLRNKLKENSSVDIIRHASDLREKYTKISDPKMTPFVQETVEKIMRFIASEQFDNLKNDLRKSKDPLANKLGKINVFESQWGAFAEKNDIEILKQEMKDIDLNSAKSAVQKKSIFESEPDDNSLQRKTAGSGSADDNDSIESNINSSYGNGSSLPEAVQNELQPSFNSNLSNVNIHTDQKAAEMSEGLKAQAFTKGNNIYFNRNKFNTSNKEGKHLLAHELTHVDQQQSNNTNGGTTVIARHAVEATDVVRKERIDLFGDGTAIKPGIEFEKFESYTRRQADWFAAPSLSVADRANLWKLLFISTEGGFVLSGTRGLLLPELIPLSAVEWNNLKAFGRACNSSMNTVRIASAIAYTLPQRLSLGTTLLQLENIIPKEVLEFTVTEEQLKDIEAKPALLPQLTLYWFLFQPQLQQKDNKVPGRNREFQQVLDLLSTPFGFFPYIPLNGRIRNLHRFTTATLDRLLINFKDTSHSKPLQLVLHSPHDSPGSFASDQPLIANLVANLDSLVLMLEGMGSLADITSEIPKIAATYGKADAKGINRIARVMISGHGETRNVSLAGTGAPNTAGDKIEYPSESLDLDDAKQAKATQDLLDALLNNLDPATAKIVFNGCLVGSNIIPPGTPAADIPKYIAAHPNLKTFTESRAAALKLGMPADLVQGARASLATPDSLMDAKGNLEIKFKDDPDVFGTAAAYVATGHEPEGLIRSAIELAAIDPVAAAAQLQLRKAKGAKAGDWWEDVTVALVEMALDGVVVGAPVSLARLHTLSSFAQTIFLVRFDFGITVSHFTSIINTDPVLAPIVYAKIAATNSFTAATDQGAENMRMIVEQARIVLGQPGEADLINFIGNRIEISRIENHLDAFTLAAKSASFFPLGALSPGKIRLAIAWIRNDKTNADVIKFLDNEVTVTPAGPTLSADVQAELTTAGIPERDILELIGRIGAPPKGEKAKEKDKANAELNGDDKNDAYVVSKPYVATVIPTIYALNVRRLPSMAGKPFAWLHPGDKVNVMGFVHEWAAIDQNGHLGFVYKTKISAPPP
jgi:Domain of unknown function (DUF4157)